MVVQGLRLHALNAGGLGSIPDLGTKIPHAVQCGQINYEKRKEKKRKCGQRRRHYSFPKVKDGCHRSKALLRQTSLFLLNLELIPRMLFNLQ